MSGRFITDEMHATRVRPCARTCSCPPTPPPPSMSLLLLLHLPLCVVVCVAASYLLGIVHIYPPVRMNLHTHATRRSPDEMNALRCVGLSSCIAHRISIASRGACACVSPGMHGTQLSVPGAGCCPGGQTAPATAGDSRASTETETRATAHQRMI